MDLPRFACLLYILPIAAVLERRAEGYQTYTVERDCRSGNLTLQLSAWGPGSVLLLRTTDHTSYSLSGECRIELRAPTDRQRIVASVREVDFRTEPDGSCRDFIRIEKPMCSHLYRLEEEHHFNSRDNTLEIVHYVSDVGLDNATLTGFPGAKLTVTAVTTADVECPDTKDWFRCQKGFCIWSDLRCDSHNNCGDRSDEQGCESPGGNRSTVLIILAVLILLLLLIMCIATLLCSKNESVRRFSNRIRSRTMSYIRRFSK